MVLGLHLTSVPFLLSSYMHMIPAYCEFSTNCRGSMKDKKVKQTWGSVVSWYTHFSWWVVGKDKICAQFRFSQRFFNISLFPPVKRNIRISNITFLETLENFMKSTLPEVNITSPFLQTFLLSLYSHTNMFLWIAEGSAYMDTVHLYFVQLILLPISSLESMKNPLLRQQRKFVVVCVNYRT